MTTTNYNKIQSRNIYPNQGWANYRPPQRDAMIPPP